MDDSDMGHEKNGINYYDESADRVHLGDDTFTGKLVNEVFPLEE